MAEVDPIMAIKSEYRIVFFPIAERIQVEDAVIVKVFGVVVYKRIGKAKSLLGKVWGV